MGERSKIGPRVETPGDWPGQSRRGFGSVKAPLPGVLMLHYAPGGRSALLGQRMMVMYQLFQPLLEHVRVDLCSRDVGMAEELLDRAQVSAAVEEGTGECVAQDVRAYAFAVEPRLLGDQLQILSEALSREVALRAFRRE